MTRILDIFFSIAGLAFLSPLFLIVSVLLKCSGEGHIFYKQKRIGAGAKPFYVLKFATMLKDSPSMAGGLLTQRDDPRILPMGGFLRWTKINELPQLLNVLLGSMSLVGPRPIAGEHFEMYPPHLVYVYEKGVPGLSGLASVFFRDEEALIDRAGDDYLTFYKDVIMPYKAELEAWYWHHRSVLIYLKVILVTAIAILVKVDIHHWFKQLPPVPAGLR